MTARRLTIPAAKRLAEAHGLDGVIIIGIGDGFINAVSYGSTVKQCRELGKALDHFVDEFEAGKPTLLTFPPAELSCITQGSET